MFFKDKVAIVTGAGSGMGESMARRLAEEGAIVLLADVNDAGGERVTEEIRAAGGRASYVHTDIVDEVQVESMVAYAVSRLGGLHLAINNAGVAHQPAKLADLDTATWDKVHDINLRGTFFCMRAQIRHMRSHGGGSIVNIASAAGLKAGPEGLAAYTASKHGVVGLTRCTAMEYIRDGIRINALAPGTTITGLITSLPAEMQKAYADLMPCGRMAEPVEMAEAALWLLSDKASYVSASVLEADMGYRQR